MQDISDLLYVMLIFMVKTDLVIKLNSSSLPLLLWRQAKRYGNAFRDYLPCLCPCRIHLQYTVNVHQPVSEPLPSATVQFSHTFTNRCTIWTKNYTGLHTSLQIFTNLLYLPLDSHTILTTWHTTNNSIDYWAMKDRLMWQIPHSATDPYAEQAICLGPLVFGSTYFLTIHKQSTPLHYWPL